MAQKDSSQVDVLTMRLPAGSFDRIHRVLKGGELRSAFVRVAVEAELQKREEAERRKRARYAKEPAD